VLTLAARSTKASAGEVDIVVAVQAAELFVMSVNELKKEFADLTGSECRTGLTKSTLVVEVANARWKAWTGSQRATMLLHVTKNSLEALGDTQDDIVSLREAAIVQQKQQLRVALQAAGDIYHGGSASLESFESATEKRKRAEEMGVEVQRLSKMQAVASLAKDIVKKVSEKMELGSGGVMECHVCNDHVTEWVVCEDKHKSCLTCMERQVVVVCADGEAEVLERGGAMCLHCPRVVDSEALMKGFVAAGHDDGAQCMAKVYAVVRAERARVVTARDMLAREARGLAGRVEAALELRCPSCNTLYGDTTDECMHARCTSRECGAKFCGYCFSMGCAAETCALNPEPDTILCRNKGQAVLVCKAWRVAKALKGCAPSARRACLAQTASALAMAGNETAMLDPMQPTLYHCLSGTSYITGLMHNTLQNAYGGPDGDSLPLIFFGDVKAGDAVMIEPDYIRENQSVGMHADGGLVFAVLEMARGGVRLLVTGPTIGSNFVWTVPLSKVVGHLAGDRGFSAHDDAWHEERGALASPAAVPVGSFVLMKEFGDMKVECVRVDAWRDDWQQHFAGRLVKVIGTVETSPSLFVGILPNVPTRSFRFPVTASRLVYAAWPL